MEPIKQAIERAKRERQLVRGPAFTEAEVTEQVQDVSKPELRREDSSEQGKQIKYTQTRSINVSDVALRNNRIMLGSINDEVDRAYKTLRTQALHRLDKEGWSIIAVTSPEDGAGKTLTSINLALSLARDVNHTVLLADLDLRGPRIHKLLGFDPDLGLSDYLLHGAPLENMLVNPGQNRLTILPGRESVAHSSEMLSSPRMVRLIKELKNRYPARVVLLDMPPILVADDVLAFSPYIDACLLVIEANKTRRDNVEKALRYLERTNVLGTVLNKCKELGRV